MAGIRHRETTAYHVRPPQHRRRPLRRTGAGSSAGSRVGGSDTTRGGTCGCGSTRTDRLLWLEPADS